MTSRRIGAFLAITVVGFAAALSAATPAAAHVTVKADGTRGAAQGAVTPQDASNNGAWVEGIGQCDVNSLNDCWAWENGFAPVSCAYEHFCLWTNQLPADGGKIFSSYHCRNAGSDWALHGWNGYGWYRNRNSGGASAALKDINHNDRKVIAAGGQGSFNFNPIYYVRAC